MDLKTNNDFMREVHEMNLIKEKVKKMDAHIEKIDSEIKKLEKYLNSIRGTDCVVYSRIVGFYMPVNTLNMAKKEEFEERKTYHISKSIRKING